MKFDFRSALVVWGGGGGGGVLILLSHLNRHAKKVE